MAEEPVVSARDLVEATTVTTTRCDGHQFEIQLGHLCNNRCVFCSSGQLTALRLARHIPLDPIVTAIEEAHASGARRVTFLGGEPTIHKGFLPALQRTVELGFDEVVIFTNGVMLPQPGFIDSIMALKKRFEWRISIQGGNEAAHVATTGRQDSFARIIHGLERLQALDQVVTANMCVNERSYRSLPEYPALVQKYGIRQLHVDIVRPSSAGPRTDEYLREIMPRYSTMAPYMRRMLEEFDRLLPEFDVNIGNLPYCILPDWGHRIGHGGEKTITQSSDATGLEDTVNKYEWHASMRSHTPRCDGCVFRGQCTGIFDAYLQLHGDQEFQPVSLEQLRQLDPHQHNFVLLTSDLLQSLFARPAPQGWTAGELQPDPRGRRTSVIMQTEQGARVWLHFSPPEGAQPATLPSKPVLSTDRFAVRLEIDGELSGNHLAPLLVWLSHAIAKTPGIKALCDTDFRVAKEQLLTAHALAAGRARVEALVREVERRTPIGPWRYGGHKARRDRPGTVVEIQGPAASRIEVLFEIGTGGGRSQVSLDFRLGPDTDEAHAWPVVQELIRALKEPGQTGDSVTPCRTRTL